MTLATKPKERELDWTLDSPATPERIDAYVKDWRSKDHGEVTQAARDITATHCKRTVEGFNVVTGGKANMKIKDIADTAIAHAEGFLAGACYALEKANAVILTRS